MPNRFSFDPYILNSVVGGKSAIDMPKLDVHSLKEAESLISGYGFDYQNPLDQEKLWYYHRRALVLVKESLKIDISEMPEVLQDRKNLEDLRKLLIWASSSIPQDRLLRKWSCALLRVMHVFVHTENDLFTTYSEEIQKQILTPIQDCVVHDGTSGKTFLKIDDSNQHETIELAGFEVKAFKTSASTVIKLLAKPDALAMSVFDKLGFRFITKNMFDTFRVVRFLVDENLISFAHIIPDQSSNNLYPVELFLKACSEMTNIHHYLTDGEIEQFFSEYLILHQDDANFFRKQNQFSASNYRFIKFIARKRIRIQSSGKDGFAFFYPFEIQIMDEAAHQTILSGPSEHEAYKERQRQGARNRILPEDNESK